MNIADGEYDIDLSVLAGPMGDLDSNTSSLAIRYGFIPDSMDQSSALHLYQGDQICILEASSSEKTKQTETLPIIFEGTPQRQRPQAAVTAPNDSYYLSFTPSDTAMETDVKVALKKLGSTIRVSKSRNAEKWRASICQWRKSAVSGDSDVALPQQIPSSDKTTKPTRAASLPARPAKNEGPKKQARHASKRPPARDSDDAIISVSDFEGLGSDSDDDQPNGPAYNKVENKTQPMAPRSEKVFAGKKVPSRAVAKSSNHDLDDEWADLEDQLEEVLESGDVPKRPASIESDEDSASDEEMKGEPIIIDVKEETHTPNQSIMPRFGNKKTPMSLRQLHGSTDANDYLSSSEEE